MFFVVTLKLKNRQNKNVWIPTHWCRGYSMETVYNIGMRRSEDLVVFYSENQSEPPNFELGIRDEFTNVNACYIGRFRMCKGNDLKFYQLSIRKINLNEFCDSLEASSV